LAGSSAAYAPFWNPAGREGDPARQRTTLGSQADRSRDEPVKLSLRMAGSSPLPGGDRQAAPLVRKGARRICRLPASAGGVDALRRQDEYLEIR
jgi:hypothetical protein